MNYKQLEALIYLTRHGNFKQAAEALYFDSPGEEYITPEAIQYRIKQLEQDLGVTLYRKRQGNARVLLTREGQLFLREALDVYQRMGEWRTMFMEEDHGWLTFATTQAVLIHRLAEPISEFHRLHRQARLRALASSAAEMEVMVSEGKVDFGISTRRPEKPDLEYLLWQRNNMVLITPQGHRLAQRDQVTLAEVVEFPMVMLEPELRGDRDLLEEALRRNGCKSPQIVMETSNSEIICNYVEMGLGVAIIAETSILRQRRQLSVVKVSQIGKSEVGLLVREGQYIPALAREFLAGLDPRFRTWLGERDARMDREMQRISGGTPRPLAGEATTAYAVDTDEPQAVGMKPARPRARRNRQQVS